MSYCIILFTGIMTVFYNHKNFMVFTAFLALCGSVGCGQHTSSKNEDNRQKKSFSLADFYLKDPELNDRVDQTFSKLTNDQKVGQMLIVAAGRLGKPDKIVESLIHDGKVGGVLLLNGSKSEFMAKTHRFDSIVQASANLPLLYSADAEPSLINRKITETPAIPLTSSLNTPEKSREMAESIARQLLDIGIRQNFAPVVDVSPDNVVIRNRSFSVDPDSVDLLAGAFIKATQAMGIVATAKHFPGHGLVKGDTHSQLVYIDGEMQELNVYRPLIQNGLLSVMVGHIAVKDNTKYDTHGLPASCSENIVSGLLKGELGFKGLVVTDAMNMGALKSIDQAELKAARAGCDMILMPPNEQEAIDQILAETHQNEAFREKIDQSVKKIIRLKICLGLMN